jgi:transposase
MASIASTSRVVVGGIDTHKDLHVAAVLDTAGVLLGTEAFSTTRAGYRALVGWLRGFGDVRLVGIEGTGSYGAGVTRHLGEAGIEVAEVDRPDRSDRRRRGKNDTIDAENAARAALAGRRTSTPKTKDGKVEALRVLRLTRTTAVKSRRVALQLLGNHIVAAPEELRDQVRNPGPHAAHPHLRRLAARHQRVPRPRGRHPHRPQVVGPPDPGAQRRDRRPRPAHHHPGR